MNRIKSQTALITIDERDYNLSVRIMPIIPSLAGRHVAAIPASLVRVSDKASVPTGGLCENYGVTEEDAARACIEKVEEFLEARNRAARI